MKKLIFITALLMLVGCDKETNEQTSNWVLPQGLDDCKIYYMFSSTGTAMHVMRCPLSSTTTTYQAGKTTRTVTVTETEMIPQ